MKTFLFADFFKSWLKNNLLFIVDKLVNLIIKKMHTCKKKIKVDQANKVFFSSGKILQVYAMSKCNASILNA